MSIDSASSVTASVTSEDHGVDNISVTVEWSQDEGVQYNVSVTPSIPITIIERRIELLLLYNIEYNVSLEAVTACQSEASTILQLFYGKLNSQDYLIVP